MSRFASTMERRALGRPSAIGWAASIIEGGLHLIRELRVRRAIRDMQDLDDGMLHDVGLSRGEIEEAVRNGRSFWQGRRI